MLFNPLIMTDSDMISKSEMNAALCTLDVVMPTIDDLPPLTIEEIEEEQGRDANLTVVRSWIETAYIPTPIDLEGYPSAIRTYATMRQYIPSR